MPAARRRQRPEGTPERWLILCRQSDTDDAGERSLSLDSQERVLRDAAEQQGSVVVAALRDADLKGYQDESARPALAEALTRASAGEYDVLAVWELSRLARKLSLQERVLDRLDAAGVRLYSHREPWASATMVRQILGAVAEEQTRSISAHVSRAMRHRRARGLWHGRAPYGYRYGAVPGVIEPDPETADWVVRIFAWFADREHLTDIVRRLTREGAPLPRTTGAGQPEGMAWYPHTVRRIVAQPAYTGRILLGGELVPGQHPAIIDEVTWRRCQDRRSRQADLSERTRRSRPGAVPTFLADGRMRCACGHRMYPVLRRKAPHAEPFMQCGGPKPATVTRRPDVSVCTVRPRQIRIWVAQERVRDLLAEQLADLRPWRAVVAEMKRERVTGGNDRTARLQAAQRRREASATRQSRSRELYVTGRIDLDELDRLIGGAVAELAALDAEIRALDTGPDPDTFREVAGLARQLAGVVHDIGIADVGRWLDDLGITVVHDPATQGRIRLVVAGPLIDLLRSR